MGWLSDITKSVFGGSSDAGSIVGDLVSTGAEFYGSYSAQKANEKAADKVAEAERANAEAIREGNQLAQDRYDQIYAETGPARNALLQSAASNPYDLTPSQSQGLEDVRRDATAGLAASGLRGAGRTVTQSLKDVESTYRNSAYDTNLRRVDSANSYLAGKGYSAADNNAAIDQATGRTDGDAIVRSAETTAQAGINNEGLRGATLGSIASYAADDLKMRGRDSKYK